MNSLEIYNIQVIQDIITDYRLDLEIYPKSIENKNKMIESLKVKIVSEKLINLFNSFEEGWGDVWKNYGKNGSLKLIFLGETSSTYTESNVRRIIERKSGRFGFEYKDLYIYIEEDVISIIDLVIIKAIKKS